MWTPINKKTKLRYPPITDAEKANWLEDKHIATHYIFENIGPSEVGELVVLSEEVFARLSGAQAKSLLFSSGNQVETGVLAFADNNTVQKNMPEPVEAKRIEEEPEEGKEKKTKTAKTKE